MDILENMLDVQVIDKENINRYDLQFCGLTCAQIFNGLPEVYAEYKGFIWSDRGAIANPKASLKWNYSEDSHGRCAQCSKSF